MQSKNIFREIFGLAVRLLGLVFLYFGLRAVVPLLDLGAIETAGRADIVTAILPIIFNLAIGWWLIGGGWLIRRAYPERPELRSRAPREEATATPTQTPQSEMEKAEKRLAPLVEKPKSGPAA